MAAEYSDFLRPRDFVRESSLGYEYGMASCDSNDLRGLALPRKTTHGYTAVSAVPGAPAMATGLTWLIMLTDDGQSTNDLGKVVRIGFTIKRLINDETTDLDTAAQAEVTVDITLSATSGGVAIGSIAKLANAVDSTAVGEFYAMRIRRVSSAAQDTCLGRVILLAVAVKNT